MTSGTWSVTEPTVNIETVDDLDKFVEFADSKAKMPTAISVEIHGYRVDLWVGHDKSFVHMTPNELSHPYHVTVGGTLTGGLEFWLHSTHHSWFENRYFVDKQLAREAFRFFYLTGHLSPTVEWEDYFA